MIWVSNKIYKVFEKSKQNRNEQIKLNRKIIYHFANFVVSANSEEMLLEDSNK